MRKIKKIAELFAKCHSYNTYKSIGHDFYNEDLTPNGEIDTRCICVHGWMSDYKSLYFGVECLSEEQRRLKAEDSKKTWDLYVPLYAEAEEDWQEAEYQKQLGGLI